VQKLLTYFPILGIFLTISAYADMNEEPGRESFQVDASATMPTVKVIFFGGYRASAAQMACWKKGAQKAGLPGLSFEAIPWPEGATSDFDGAREGGAAEIQHVVSEINGNKTGRFIVVGHSSGAALASVVAEKVANPSQIQLVDLDGFVAPLDAQNRLAATHRGDAPGFLCVHSERRNRGSLMSLNATAMRKCAHGYTYTDNHCNTTWCMHFSLVDKADPADLGLDYPQHGYDGCDTNLDWIKAVLPNISSEEDNSAAKPLAPKADQHFAAREHRHQNGSL
jgi:hypothetical protein